jgi:signal transduction histidine kinase
MKTLARTVCVILLQGLIYSSTVFSAEVVLSAEERQWLTEHPVIRLSPDPAFAPIEEVNVNGEYVGMAADYMTLIEKKINFKFTVVGYPTWKQVVEETKQKNVDVLAAITQSAQREEYLNFTTPHIKLPGMIIVSDRTAGKVTIDDLKNMKVASPAGYVWFDLIGYDHPEIKLLEAATLREGLRDLSFGLLDAVVADPATVTQVIKEEGLSNLRIGGETGYFFELAFAARKDWPILRDILEKSIQSIHKEEHAAIFDSWIQFKGEEGISQNVLIGLAISLTLLILLAMGFMFVNMLLRIRVAQQTEELNEANANLSEVNVELERRVVERTSDLEKAYSELKHSQVKMVQSEKMAALGQMIAGIAHEINTPLGYAHSNVVIMKDFIEKVKKVDINFRAWKNLMSDGFSSEDDISNKFLEVDDAFAELNENDEIEECGELATDTLYGLDQISDITQNLKDFSRLDQAEIDDININDNIERTLKLAKNLLKDHIHVELSLGQIPSIKCNPSKINQVLLNLITNACHAIDVSGKEVGKLAIDTDFDGDRVNIIIKDNGIGIAKDVGKKMFDPFYTTKEIGQGTGLGLSICYNIIVKEHKGQISVRTREGVGTKFTISLRAENIDILPVEPDVISKIEASVG